MLDFTVFTATYNRAHTLSRVFDSLVVQTHKNFEWLIVDDGSTDGTEQLVENWKREASFPIRYLYQRNSGKAVAFNRGVRAARGTFFLNLDSDDACLPNALERLITSWKSIPESEKGQFSGVTALSMDQHGQLYGKPFVRDELDSDSLEMWFKYTNRGEKWGFHRTDVLLDFPFPEPEEAKFVSEGVVWFALARKYKTRYINERLRVYYINDKAGDHLTDFGRSAILGRLPFHLKVMNDCADYFKVNPFVFSKSVVAYVRYSLGLQRPVRQQLKPLRSAGVKALLCLLFPVGWLLNQIDRVREKRTV